MTHRIKRKTKWREVLPIHPAAATFPRPSASEAKALAADIKEHGLLTPVVLWAANDDTDTPYELLDGISRLDALEAAGIPLVDDGLFVDRVRIGDRDCEFHVEKNAVEIPDPWAYVESVNLKRRHLSTKGKRAWIAVLLKQDPKRTDFALAKRTGINDKTIASVRAELESRSEIPTVKTRIDTRGRQQPSKQKHDHGRGRRAAGTSSKLAATSLRTWQVQRVSNIIKRLKLIGKKITAELIAEAAADRDLVGRDPPIPVAVVAEVLDELRASGEFERLVAKAQPAQQPGATLPAAVGGDRYSEHSVKADGQGNAQPTGAEPSHPPGAPPKPAAAAGAEPQAPSTPEDGFGDEPIDPLDATICGNESVPSAPARTLDYGVVEDIKTAIRSGMSPAEVLKIITVIVEQLNKFAAKHPNYGAAADDEQTEQQGNGKAS